MTMVAILGSGPAGLLAALAVEQAGHMPFIYSLADKSPMFGAMYLHEPIPGMHDINRPDFEIDVVKSGSREGYAYNVYGDKEAPCSWDFIQEGPTGAWDLKKTYDVLWDRYESSITNMKIGPSEVGSLCSNFPLVLCSVPAPALCSYYQHQFPSQQIWVLHGPHIHPVEGVNGWNMMYYNGTPHDGSFAVGEYDHMMDPAVGEHIIGFDWYRFSQIEGYQAWEYSRVPKVANDNPRTLSVGKKPLTTNCDCWTRYRSFRRIGRFGKWHKGVLTHHAYREASEAARAL